MVINKNNYNNQYGVMISKIIALFAIVFLLFGPTVISANALSSKSPGAITNDEGLIKDLLISRSTISIRPDEEYDDEPIIPLAPTVTIPIIIGNLIEGGFTKPIISYCNKKDITQEITLSIGKTPAWCTAIIEPKVVHVEVNNEWEWVQANLKVSLEEKAPAYKEFRIPIKATSTSIKGPLNIVEWIKGSEKIQNFSFTPGYLPIIDLFLPHNYMEISPVDKTEIPIKLENLGNGKTEVIIEIGDLPKKWSASIPSTVLLETNSEKEIILEVKPEKSFKRETITINVKGRYYAISSDTEGFVTPTYTYRITFKNDGSHRGEIGGSNIYTIIILLVGIVIIGILLMIIKKKKAKR